MSWFQKKAMPSPPPEESQPVGAKRPEDSRLERDACCRHLSEVMNTPSEHGVVLKVYIENFKRLNQVFGYDYCEDLLSQILACLKEKTGQPVFHYIGVEYIMILDRYTQGQATELADQIADQFDHAWKVNGTDCLCSVQMGMCSYPGLAAGPEELLKCLDLAVLRAEEGGPNQAIMFDSTLQKQLLRRHTIALYLKTAVEREEIEVRYRPTLNMETGKFSRAEFYMRIFIKGLGLIGAGEVLPIAEDSGQIRSLEYFALDKVGQCIRELTGSGREFESIALPISPVLFLQEDFLDEVRRVMDLYKIPKGKLAIEIQESALTTAYLNINIMLQKLAGMGVELVLNEFGSGYSGIATILELPVSALKLERLFVWQLETNPRSRCIIEGLIHIARDLDLKIIAEGVETENQVNILTNAGCNCQQGFYYSPTLEQDTLLQVIGSTFADSVTLLDREKEKMTKS